VANVTTAAQLFHLLRRQVLQPVMRPLVLFTPKRYLRAREAYSGVDELTDGAFQEVIGDPGPGSDQVHRVVLASGKVALDLASARATGSVGGVALVRLEQLYPWPDAQVVAALDRYPAAREVVWAQEEPANMGAWPFVRDRLAVAAGDRTLTVVARPASGSPATGSHLFHELEQADVLARALGA
jgi:2-oxoglutarate dehydrogenase complex dehydrogenase (E1) component-like enzyme